MRLSYPVVLLTLLLSCTPLHLSAQPSGVSVPTTGFLCCNMRTDGSWISDINYAESGKTMVPLGTPIRLLGYGRYRVQVELQGRRQALGNDYSRDLSKEVFAARYIVPSDPREQLASLPAKTRTAIESARLTRGMSKEQVLMAVGYPISSENPHLDARVWRYWLWSFSPFTVNFTTEGTVANVEADAETLTKVFID